jgi:hypothetical protein
MTAKVSRATVPAAVFSPCAKRITGCTDRQSRIPLSRRNCRTVRSEARASRQPRSPQLHSGPSGCRGRWPNSPAKKLTRYAVGPPDQSAADTSSPGDHGERLASASIAGPLLGHGEGVDIVANHPVGRWLSAAEQRADRGKQIGLGVDHGLPYSRTGCAWVPEGREISRRGRWLSRVTFGDH